MWPIAASAAASHRSVRTGRPDSAWNVSGADELPRALGHHDLHLGALLAQAPDEFGALVGGDAAGDAEQDACRGAGAFMGRLWDGANPGRKGTGRKPASRSEAITGRQLWQAGQK